MKKNGSGLMLGAAMMAQMSASCQCLHQHKTRQRDGVRDKERRVLTKGQNSFDTENIIKTPTKLRSVIYKSGYLANPRIRATALQMPSKKFPSLSSGSHGFVVDCHDDEDNAKPSQKRKCCLLYRQSEG